MVNDKIKTERRFPVIAFVVILLITLALFLGVGWGSLHSYKDIKTIQERDLQLQKLVGTIIHLDEVLTMSARMGTKTGDLKWEERYLYFEPQLDAAIKKAKRLAPEIFLIEAAEQTNAANIKLVRIEKQAFELVRQGQNEAASALLFNKEYEEQKKIYAEGMKRITVSMQGYVKDVIKEHRHHAYITFIVISFTLPSLIFAWIYILRSMKKYSIKRKVAEIELKESEAKFQSILSSLYEAAIIVYDRDGKIMSLWGTPEMDKRYGMPAVEVVDRSIREFSPPEQAEQLIAQIRRIMDTGTKVIYEHMIFVPNGNFWHETSLCPMRNDKGDITAAVGFMRDITGRKLAEKELREKNSYLRLLQVAAVSANEAEDIKDAFQPILKEICGYTGWEIGHAYVISKDDPNLLEPTTVWYIEDSKHFEEFRRVSKRITFARGIGLPGRVLASAKPHWIVDVTKDKNFLRTNISKYLNIKSGIAFPVLVGNKVAAVMTFFTTKALEPDQPFMEIMADIGTQLGRAIERKQAEDTIQSLVKSTVGKTGQEYFDGIVSNMCKWLGTDCAFIGQIMEDVNVKALSMQLDGKITYDYGYSLDGVPTPCGNVANKGYSIYYEEVCKLFPEDKVLLEMGAEGYVGTPLRDKSGKSIGLLWAVSRHKLNLPSRAKEVLEIIAAKAASEIERKQMEEALLQSEKMKAMGIMTSGVAHEFNNILAVISSNAQLLEEANRNDKELTKTLRTICRVADDGAAIVDRMYEFTDIRKNASQYFIMDLTDLIKQVIDYTMPRWKEMAHASGITYDIDQKGMKVLPPVLVNPSELREVFLNIINNALDAMPNGGTITVKTRSVRSSESGVRRKEEIVSKLRTPNSELNSDFVEISFADTGKGMSDEVRNKVFDPFYTTRSPEGTGLGMSVSYGIITRHGGRIDIESAVGKGSKIIISLPQATKTIKSEVLPKPASVKKVKNLNVLVVDDEEDLCDSLSSFFKKDGHTVRCVSNGSKAIKLLKNSDFDLLICDLVMPETNGREVIKVLDTLNKRPKVGLITAWSYKSINGEDLNVDFVVKKPFSLSELRKNINNIFSS